MTRTRFPGFSASTTRFLRALARNNDRTWFQDHRHEYEAHVLEPAREFVEALGVRARRLVPGIRAEPRIDGSILRVRRDTRFTKDKTPYRPWLGITLWEGDGLPRESPCFFLSIGPRKTTIDGGQHRFTRGQLERYREAVLDTGGVRGLRRAIDRATRAGLLQVHSPTLQRAPRGIAPDQANIDLLCHLGLYVTCEVPTKWLQGPEAVDVCHDAFRGAASLHRWLMAHVVETGHLRGPA